MAATKPIYVSPHKDGWQVKREKGKKALFVTSTKKEAMDKAREIAISSGCYVVEKDAEGKVVGTQTSFVIDVKKMKPVKPVKKKTAAKKTTAKKAAPKKPAKKPVAKKTVAKKKAKK